MASNFTVEGAVRSLTFVQAIFFVVTKCLFPHTTYGLLSSACHTITIFRAKTLSANFMTFSYSWIF
jgi:hypothetical protein